MVIQETHRSKAYLQNMIKHKILPNFVLLLSSSGKIENLDTLPSKQIKNYFDPSKTEEQSLIDSKIPYKRITADSCNDSNVIEELKKREEDYFVFSGRGILNEIFDSNKKFIHVHPGKLPEYRGSTCPYYSILQNNGWWATSFIMNPKIDQGETIISRSFYPPKQDIDLTRVFDPYTRSEVLVDTLMQFINNKSFDLKQQDLSKGTDYYTIHPVLEHIAKKSFK